MNVEMLLGEGIFTAEIASFFFQSLFSLGDKPELDYKSLLSRVKRYMQKALLASVTTANPFLSGHNEVARYFRPEYLPPYLIMDPLKNVSSRGVQSDTSR